MFRVYAPAGIRATSIAVDSSWVDCPIYVKSFKTEAFRSPFAGKDERKLRSLHDETKGRMKQGERCKPLVSLRTFE